MHCVFLPFLCRRAEKAAPGVPGGQREAEMPQYQVSRGVQLSASPAPALSQWLADESSLGPVPAVKAEAGTAPAVPWHRSAVAGSVNRDVV